MRAGLRENCSVSARANARARSGATAASTDLIKIKIGDGASGQGEKNRGPVRELHLNRAKNRPSEKTFFPVPCTFMRTASANKRAV